MDKCINYRELLEIFELAKENELNYCPRCGAKMDGGKP